MQVAHRHDYDTHAVVGGQNVQGFGIATTAEFFTVLSSTLYSNKPLAMVREYLCNGWDAHIAAGRQDIPLEITINDDKIIFKDHGYGIPHDLIHEVFCIYGNSTKANDGKQTGGFGLGSKAGFAYSDHFTVTNCHAGTKVVHAISRGSALTQGTPDRREMVRVPTDEEGLEVSIPVKSRQDRDIFIKLVKELASFGEMNVQLDGRTIPTVPISENENNLFLTERDIPNQQGKIYVRYGNVLYPVNEHDDYIAAYNRITKFLGDLAGRKSYSNNWKLILQADPNTISVTPSRESLSMTFTTIETLKELLTDVWEEMRNDTPKYNDLIIKHLRTAIDYAYRNGRAQRLLDLSNPVADYALKIERGQPEKLHYDITNINDLVYHRITRSVYYGSIPSAFLTEPVQALLDGGGWRREHDLKTFLWINKWKAQKTINADDRYFNKKVLRPLVTKLAKHTLLQPKHMYVATPGHSGKRMHGFASLAKYYPDTSQQKSLLAGVVIVAYSKFTYSDHYDNQHFPHNTPRLVYVAPRTKDHKDQAVSFFQKLGYHVIDFAAQHDAWVKEQDRLYGSRKKDDLLPTLPKEKKPQGLPSMMNLRGKNGSFDRRGHLARQSEDPYSVKRIENPEYIFKPHNLGAKHWDRKFFEFDDNAGRDILDLIGPKGAICANETQYNAYKEKGFKDGYLYLAEFISQEILTNTRIRDYFGMEAFFVETRDTISKLKIKDLINLILLSERLQKEFQVSDPVTDQDEKVIRVYKIMHARTMQHTKYEKPNDWMTVITDTQTKIKTWSAPPAMLKLILMMQNNPMFSILDIDQMDRLLRSDSKLNPDYKLRTFVEVCILNSLKLK